jgi:hypothetical protein
MNKRDLTEQEIRTLYITPAIHKVGRVVEQIRRKVYRTSRQITPDNKSKPRGEPDFAGDVLTQHHLPASQSHIHGKAVCKN